MQARLKIGDVLLTAGGRIVKGHGWHLATCHQYASAPLRPASATGDLVKRPLCGPDLVFEEHTSVRVTHKHSQVVSPPRLTVPARPRCVEREPDTTPRSSRAASEMAGAQHVRL